MPHLYVNGRFLTRRMTGVERFAYNTCKAMAAMGYCENILRLPLTPMEKAHEARLKELMAEQRLI